MKRNVVTVSPDTPTLEAIEKMRAHRVGSLPIVEDGKLVGIITETDLFNIFLEMLGARRAGVRGDVGRGRRATDGARRSGARATGVGVG